MRAEVFTLFYLFPIEVMCSVLQNFVNSGYISKGYKTKTPANDHHENPDMTILIILTELWTLSVIGCFELKFVVFESPL